MSIKNNHKNRMTFRTRRSGSMLALPAVAVPDRIVPMLAAGVAALATVYVVLMVTTIFFATLQTKMVHSIEETRGSIERLETEYYAAITRIDATDPAAIGLVTPKEITYVTAARDTNLTFAR